MQVKKTAIPGVMIVEPQVFRDERGFFIETYHFKRYADYGLDATFLQDNHSRSVRNTLRGLHSQRRFPQGKLVRAVEGSVFDVAVDIRPTSPTFKKWVGVELSADNFRQFYIPPGFAHGFCVLTDTAQFEYKCTDYYHPEDEIVVRWDDPELAIDWPISEPILSQRDTQAPFLRDIAWS